MDRDDIPPMHSSAAEANNSRADRGRRPNESDDEDFDLLSRMSSHQDAQGRGSEMMFVPAPQAAEAKEQPQSQEEQPQNSALKASMAQDPASASMISRRQEEAVENRSTDSMYSKRLEEKLPADDLLHQMIGADNALQESGVPAAAGAADGEAAQRAGDNAADETIKMLCEEHKAPAVFFSQQQDCYYCFKCLVTSGQLLYIDQSYKQEMEDFERIRDLTADAVTSNIENTTITKQWKARIRACLMEIRTQFNHNIEKFIELFSEKFKDVEMSTDLLEFRGEDKKLHQMVEDLQKKYCEILGIFNNIANSSAHQRIKYIDNIKSYMKGIERKVKDQDAYIKNQAKKLREALDKTVSLDGINQKMEIKLIKYLNKELKRKYENTSNARNPHYDNLDDTQAIFFDMNYRGSQVKKPSNMHVQPRILDSMNLSAIDFDNTVPIMETNETQMQDLHNLQSNKNKGIVSNRPQFGQSPQTQMMAPMRQAARPQIIEMYRHKGLNTLYYLKPDSQNIFLLDFKQQSFVKEKIQSETRLPSGFSSCQTEDGCIYMVGGAVKDLVLRNTFRLDQNLNYEEMSPMKNQRFNTPICLLKDNFILAAGGQVSASAKLKYTNAVEIFDIKKNQWQTLTALLMPRGNTSMCQIAHRHVFIFNGLPRNTQRDQSNSIEYIDLGQCDAAALKKARWEPVLIPNSDFIVNEPRASAQIGQLDIIVFGGQGNNTYQVDFAQMLANKANQNSAPQQAQTAQAQNVARVAKLPESQLMSDTKFCYDSDFAVRTFGNYLYAVDGQKNYLHVYSIKDKQWNFSSLVDLGIK